MLKAAQVQSSGASLAPLGRWGDERSPGDDGLVQIMLVAGGDLNPRPLGYEPNFTGQLGYPKPLHAIFLRFDNSVRPWSTPATTDCQPIVGQNAG